MFPVDATIRHDALRVLLIVAFLTTLLFLVNVVTGIESDCVAKHGTDYCKELLR